MKKNKKMFYWVFFTAIIIGVIINFVPYVDTNWIIKLIVILFISIISGFLADKYIGNNSQS
jgi:membrane protein implicated in regulation of membrane protease activity